MAGPLKVLGVDPGSRSTGWGVVTREAGRYRLLAAGAIRPPTDVPMAERLHAIQAELAGILRLWTPDVFAIEAIFAHKSATSALILGQARGVALAAAAAAGLPVYEYNANTIKSAVAGSGRADKEAVGKMVAILLGGRIEGPHDAADAVAIAMTHHAHAHRHAAEARVAAVTAKLAAATAGAVARGPKLPTSLAELAAVKASRATPSDRGAPRSAQQGATKAPTRLGPKARPAPGPRAFAGRAGFSAGGGVAGGDSPPPHEEEPE